MDTTRTDALTGRFDTVLAESLTCGIHGAVSPQLIVLFGSHAHGLATPESDVDLLVVVDQQVIANRGRRKLAADLRRNIRAGTHPVDLIVISPAELDQWRDCTNHVVARAMDEGVILYERSSDR